MNKSSATTNPLYSREDGTLIVSVSCKTNKTSPCISLKLYLMQQIKKIKRDTNRGTRKKQ